MSARRPKTLEEETSFVRDVIEQADALRRQKRFSDGISLLHGALQRGFHQHRETIWYRLGNIYFDAGDLVRAESAYKQALNIDSHHVNAMHNLAVVYRRQKRIGLYVKTYRRARRLELRRPRPHEQSADEKKRTHRLYVRVLVWLFAGLGAVVLLVWTFTR